MPSKKNDLQQLTNTNQVEQIEANLRSLKATLEERVAERTAIVQLLQDIAVAANEAATIDTAMQFALDRVCAHTGWPVGHVYMPGPNNSDELVPTNIWHLDNPQQFKSFLEITEEVCFAKGGGLPGRVLATAKPAWIVDVTQDPNFSRARLAVDIGVKAGFAFPVLVGKEVVGVLEFFSDEALEPDEPLLELMAHVGTQLGRVVERKRSEEQIRTLNAKLEERLRERITSFQAVTVALSEALTPAQVTEVVVNQGVSALGAGSGSVVLLDEQGANLEILNSVGYPQESIKAWHRFPITASVPLAETVRTGEPIFIESFEALAIRYPELAQQRIENHDSFACLPLMVEGRTIGGIGLSFAERQSFREEDRSFMLALAQQCAQALERARLYAAEQSARQEAEVAQQRLAFLAEASSALASSLDYETTLQSLALLVIPLIADYCAIHILEESDQVRQVAEAYIDSQKEDLLRELSLLYPVDLDQPDSPVAKVLHMGEALLISDTTETVADILPPDKKMRQAICQPGAKAVIILPLIARGQTLGALSFLWAGSDRRYDWADLELAEELARRAAVAVDNARLYHEAQKLNAELEERVIERTAELRATNAKLENEIAERKQTEEALQKSQALFRALFKSAPDAAILVNSEGRIERVNKQMEKMFGYSRAELLDKPVEILMPARFRGRHISHRALYYAEPRTRAMGASLELYGKRKDGSEFPIDIVLSPVQVEDEIGVISVIRDTTESKQREEEIRQAKEFSERLINSSLDGILAFDRDCCYTVWNPAMERISGVSKAKVLGQCAFEIFPFLQETGEDKYFYEALTGNASIARDRPYYIGETDRQGFFEGYYSPIRNEFSEVVGGLAIIRDITERKQMEAELAEVGHRLMEEREAERLYLAQELHDGPVQDLHSISYRLGELEDALIDEGSLGRLVAAQVALQKIIQMLRAICGELRPPTLAPFGLEKALRSHTEQFQAEHPEIEVRLDLMPDGQRLTERVRLALFRIYQEALHNVVRHAEASYVSIRLTLDASQVILEIQDDGRGFKLPKRQIQLARAGHLGIVGAIERAEAIGGHLRVISAPGEGAVIRAVVPCQDETKQLNSLS